MRGSILNVIAGGAVLLCAALFVVWVLVNWATGCGETIYTASGSYPGECVSFVELWGPVVSSVL
jgi:hypothetical protein